MAHNPNDLTHPSPLIATLWRQWLDLDAARHAARGPDGTIQDRELDAQFKGVSLMIAAVPAMTWADVLPKVSIAAVLRSEGECEVSHSLVMIEAAVAIDHERLQPADDAFRPH